MTFELAPEENNILQKALKKIAREMEKSLGKGETEAEEWIEPRDALLFLCRRALETDPAATPEGMKVTITVELTAVDRRRLSFRFEVHDEVEKVGEGTHERFIVDPAMRMPRLQAKVDAWRAKK